MYIREPVVTMYIMVTRVYEVNGVYIKVCKLLRSYCCAAYMKIQQLMNVGPISIEIALNQPIRHSIYSLKRLKY